MSTRTKKKRVLPPFATIRNGVLVTDRRDSRLCQMWFENDEQREARLRIEEAAKNGEDVQKVFAAAMAELAATKAAVDTVAEAA